MIKKVKTAEIFPFGTCLVSDIHNPTESKRDMGNSSSLKRQMTTEYGSPANGSQKETKTLDKSSDGEKCVSGTVHDLSIGKNLIKTPLRKDKPRSANTNSSESSNPTSASSCDKSLKISGGNETDRILVAQSFKIGLKEGRKEMLEEVKDILVDNDKGIISDEYTIEKLMKWHNYEIKKLEEKG